MDSNLKPPQSRPVSRFRRFMRARFNLRDDKADDAEIETRIREGVELRGATPWILVFAIFVASVGLNALQALSLVRATSDEDAVPVEVTVMFTDLEGFTRYTAEHGDEAAVALVSEHQRQVGPIVRSRGGRIVKRMGDGLMLAFPAPEAAVLAGLELVDAVEVPLRLRAGIHIGEAVVTHDDIVGHAVNVAARITEETQAGTVLVSVDVREAVSREADGVLRGVTFGRARRYKLKGLEPVSLCRVEREW